MTSETYDGKLRGRAPNAPSPEAAADAMCDTLTAASGVGGRWQAYISSPHTSVIDHIQGNGPWVLANGLTLFANRAQLTVAPVNLPTVDEFGRGVVGNIWTGTLRGGVRAAEDCEGWASSGDGIYGAVWQIGAGYFPGVGELYSCSTRHHLLCLER